MREVLGCIHLIVATKSQTAYRAYLRRNNRRKILICHKTVFSLEYFYNYTFFANFSAIMPKSFSKTRIITTIGPSSSDSRTLQFFADHHVRYARLNFSHSTSQWHIEAGKLCRKHGLELLIDLGGPKIRLGEMDQDVPLQAGDPVIVEYADKNRTYPRRESDIMVLPISVNIAGVAEHGKTILIDDGKVALQVDSVEGTQVLAHVTYGGIVRQRKGVNIPNGSPDVDFLTHRDKEMLRDTLVILRPEVVACSFVKSVKDVQLIKKFIHTILAEHAISGYFPKICPKIEQFEAVQEGVLEDIVDESDIVMIARGDLALEVTPLHIQVPFYQERIKNVCKAKGKQFIVATQILESMIDSPVPTRAEMSDLYRAVVLDDADYIMLSGESAMGKYAIECVDLMSQMISQTAHLQTIRI